MSNLEVKTTEKGDTYSVALNGSMDEFMNLPILDVKNFKSVIFDFGQVDSINSAGISKWLIWIKDCVRVNPSFAEKLEIIKLPMVIVQQINMIAGFLPEGAKVSSFFVPYFCDATEEVSNRLLKCPDNFSISEPGAAPTFNIPSDIESEDGVNFEIDVDLTNYCEFLTELQTCESSVD